MLYLSCVDPRTSSSSAAVVAANGDPNTEYLTILNGYTSNHTHYLSQNVISITGKVYP